jgi:N-acetylglucosamine kinase
MHYGFDIGGTKIEFVVFSENDAVLFKKRVSTPVDTYNKFVNTIYSLVEEADMLFQSKRTIGIGICGVVDRRSGKIFSANIPALNGENLFHDLKDKLKTNIVSIENDCKCFAYSEANGGEANNFASVFGAILGTGVGGGFCLDKKLVNGANGLTGEWGHSQIAAMFVEKYNLPLLECGCGGKGCIENYISGNGLAYLNTFCGGEKIDSFNVIYNMRKGEIIALKAFTIFMDILAYSLVTLIHILDPQAIVFGGGLSNIDEIYEQLPMKLKNYLLPVLPVPHILKAKFGDSSGVRGAALLGKSLTEGENNHDRKI